MKLVKWAALTLALIIVLALAGLGATLLLNPKRAAELAKRPASLAQVASENAAGEKTAGPAKDPTPPAGLTFSKRLAEAGVKSCLSLIDDLGKGVMGGVANFVPASNWDIDAPDQHMASVFLGQKYSNAKLPFGFASLFGAPRGEGGCDGVSMQILPSPLECAALQQDLLKRGKLLGNLAGVSLIQDVASQIALVPTSANTCVMVSVRTVNAAKP